MSQITSGLRSVLGHPLAYDLFQKMMGASRSRQKFVDDYIRPISGCKILDIGCGTARILDYLPADIEYHGFDLSQRYIRSASQRYGERGKFTCSLVDKIAVEHLPGFDIVLAIGLLHHLNDNQVHDFMGLARNALRENGRLISIDPCFSNDQSHISRLLVSRDRGQNVRSSEEYSQLACAQFSQVNGAVKHQSWIPYTHYLMECSK